MTRLTLVALALPALLCAGQAMAGETISGPAAIIDGDTIRIKLETIRLSGIDAPELHQKCSGGKWPWINECGVNSSVVLSALVNGKMVSCIPSGHDRYRRTVAVCRTETVPDLGSVLVREGFAIRYPKYDPKCRYCAAEAEAKAAHRGLWQSEFQMPWEWRKEHRR